MSTSIHSSGRILAASSLLQGATDAATVEPPPPAPVAESPGPHGLRPAPKAQGAGAPRVARSLENRDRLHRLRRELGKIDPPPACPEEAHEQIAKAMARAGLAGWSLPALSDPETAACGDGSVRIRLLAHVIAINRSGAFRIVDLHSPQQPFFELGGRGGRTFVPMPLD
jgi:hypothetical protein